MSANKKLPFITSTSELMNMTFPPRQWLVEGLLRTACRRPSLLLGKPQSGKSTLSRQLAVEVAKGQSFLGRVCTPAEVLYWQTEEDLSDIQEAFGHLGYDSDRDRQIHIFNAGPLKNDYKNLNDALHAYPAAKLVVIETLDDLMKIGDLNSNSDISRAFETFHERVASHHYQRVAFLILHHLKKRETDSKGDQIMGGTTLRSHCDSFIYLDSKDDKPETKRFLKAITRRGLNISNTYLEFDPKREHCTLGMPLAQEYKFEAAETEKRIQEKIIDFYRVHPGADFEKDCNPIVQGDSDTKRRICKELVATGRLRKTPGKKGRPTAYHVVELPPKLTEDLKIQFGEDAA